MSLIINYDGTLFSLNKELNNISKIFKGYSPYFSTIEIIKKNIIPEIEKYNKYYTIYINNIILKNSNGKNIIPLFYNSKNNNENFLYNWFFTKILLYIILLFIVMTIIIFIISYFLNFDILNILYKNIIRNIY